MPFAVIVPSYTEATAASVVEYVTLAHEGVFFALIAIFSPITSFLESTDTLIITVS